jgi:hypothetical protein
MVCAELNLSKLSCAGIYSTFMPSSVAQGLDWCFALHGIMKDHSLAVRSIGGLVHLLVSQCVGVEVWG